MQRAADELAALREREAQLWGRINTLESRVAELREALGQADGAIVFAAKWLDEDVNTARRRLMSCRSVIRAVLDKEVGE